MRTQTEAIRKVADFIDANGDLFGVAIDQVSVHIDNDDLNIFIPTWAKGGGKVDQKAILRQVIRAIPGKFDKDFKGSTMYLKQKDAFGYFDLTIFADREGVCERILVGLKDIPVPAQEATEARVDTVPVYEWECKSIFAEDAADDRELVNA